MNDTSYSYLAGPNSIEDQIVSYWETSESLTDICPFASRSRISYQSRKDAFQAIVKQDRHIEIILCDIGKDIIEIFLRFGSDYRPSHFVVFSPSAAL